MDAELAPCPLLEDLFQGAGSARKRDESVRELGKAGLSLVHGLDHMELVKTMMCNLALDERARHHSDHRAAALQGRVCNNSHQSDAAAAVDDRRPCGGDRPRRACRGVGIDGIVSQAGPTKHAYVHRMAPLTG